MDPNMHDNLFPMQHFVRTYTHNSKSAGCMWTFYILNDSSTIGDWALFPMMQPFIRTKSCVMTYMFLQSIASTKTLQCLFNHSGHYKYTYANINCNEKFFYRYFLISLVHTHSLAHGNKFVAKQKKKQQKLGVKNFLYKLTTSRDGPVKCTETRQG